MNKNLIMKCFKTIVCVFIIQYCSITVFSQNIFEAIREGKTETVQKILNDDQKKLNSKDSLGRTPLHLASIYGHPDITEYLLKQNAKIDATDNYNITPLAYAVSRNYANISEQLLQRGADPNPVDNDGDTPLHYAAASGFPDLVKLLLKFEANTDIKNAYGRTPLVIAARESGNLNIVKQLIRNEADINSFDNSGNTALILGAWRGYEDIVNYLIKHDAYVPINDETGEKLFQYALNKRLYFLYTSISKKVSDFNSLNGKGNSVLCIASIGGSSKIVKDLISRNYSVNEQDTFGMAPVHYAVKYGRTNVLKILIKHGADLNASTKLNENPYDIALKTNNTTIQNLLQTEGAKKNPNDHTPFSGKYFGQNEIFNKPELFGLGIVTNFVGGHSNVSFSPSGDEAFWTEWNLTEKGYADGCMILYSKIENGYWTKPIKILDKGDSPMFSYDGTKLFFLEKTINSLGKNIQRIRSFKMPEIHIDSSEILQFDVKGNRLYWQFSFDISQNIYFSTDEGLKRSLFTNNSYSAPEALTTIYHENYTGGSPFISPKGDYIIFSSGNIGESYGLSDLYIGFKKPDGSWTDPINLGKDINSEKDDLLPVVSPDGKYLFYQSFQNGLKGIYRVSADIIEICRSKAVVSY